MTYWIYYNWHLKRGAIHAASCGNCNAGKGKRPGTGSKHGAWYGPITGGLRALVEARKLSPDIHFCKVCGPRKGERRKGVGDDTAV